MVEGLGLINFHHLWLEMPGLEVKKQVPVMHSESLVLYCTR